MSMYLPITMGFSSKFPSYLDPFLGVFTGFLAYYLYETHPRTAVPPDHRLAALLRWKFAKYRTERLRAMAEAEQVMLSSRST